MSKDDIWLATLAGAVLSREAAALTAPLPHDYAKPRQGPRPTADPVDRPGRLTRARRGGAR